MVQWGVDVFVGSGTGSDTFTPAFNAAPYQVLVSCDSTANDATVSTTSWTNTTLNYRGTSAARDVSWIAIGPVTL